jgi:hypothetical protein
MTSNEQMIKQRLHTSIQKCRLHMKRLQYASNQIAELFPLTIVKYNTFSEAIIGNIDQLVFRFTKLQDEIGTNTFRFLLDYLEEDNYNKPFRDILNLLERLLIIDSSDTWLTLRELRNDLAHEYPMMFDETIEKLNQLYKQIPSLEQILLTIEQQEQQYN